MASPQVELMSQIRAMADVIANITVENVAQLKSTGKIRLSSEEMELLATMIRNSVDQGFTNAAGSLIRTIDRRVT